MAVQVGIPGICVVISGNWGCSADGVWEFKVDSKLLSRAWRLWRNGSPLELVDPTISENCETEQVTRCIHIALLCVQRNPTDRPSLSTIHMMLINNSPIFYLILNNLDSSFQVKATKNEMATTLATLRTSPVPKPSMM
ncbi:PREDICTED: cysteine-rich receptor-like protein kinase 11 [Camelina sativa]|uniref:Cysteine-rich receptor-like protein kinase 11 n=1 Tax=Camelina sativa TaxID=90675 RepID=A0ABM0XXM2_CAMSA|nr:PREDICTED: cysteine-rich receptor-like protein kinase 11 [Camelina sativa]